MLDGGLCMECLGSQFYDPMTQTCKTCHESCRSCSGPGQYSCVACAFPLHLDRLNNQCVPCCPTGALPEDQSCCHCDKDTGMLYDPGIHLRFATPVLHLSQIWRSEKEMQFNLSLSQYIFSVMHSNEEKWKCKCNMYIEWLIFANRDNDSCC